MSRQRHFLRRAILRISGFTILSKVRMISNFFFPSALFGYIRSVDSVSEIAKESELARKQHFFPAQVAFSL